MSRTVQPDMIYLDNEEHWFIARDRRELITALLEYLDPEHVDLYGLDAACLGYDPLDVVVLGN